MCGTLGTLSSQLIALFWEGLQTSVGSRPRWRNRLLGTVPLKLNLFLSHSLFHVCLEANNLLLYTHSHHHNGLSKYTGPSDHGLNREKPCPIKAFLLQLVPLDILVHSDTGKINIGPNAVPTIGSSIGPRFTAFSGNIPTLSTPCSLDPAKV